MGAVYLSKFPVTVVGSKVYRVAIDAPPRGEVIRAQIIQIGGGKSIFEFSMYNSAVSCPPDPLDVNGMPVPPVPALVIDPMVEYFGQIGPTRAVTVSADRYLAADGSDGGWIQFGTPYVNQDGGVSNAKGKLYLKFSPSSSGNFGIFITIKTATG